MAIITISVKLIPLMTSKNEIKWQAA